MNQRYDVIIIGCGEAGIYAGYELSLKNPSLKIGVFEQGRDIYKRRCPIVAKKVKQCINCKVCDTMCGFGGAASCRTARSPWKRDTAARRSLNRNLAAG